MPIIVNLDVMMAKRKVSAGDLAKAIGITPANLSILKNGKAKAVRFTTLEALCRELNCQPGDILEYVPEEGQQTIHRNHHRKIYYWRRHCHLRSVCLLPEKIIRLYAAAHHVRFPGFRRTDGIILYRLSGDDGMFYLHFQPDQPASFKMQEEIITLPTHFEDERICRRFCLRSSSFFTGVCI